MRAVVVEQQGGPEALVVIETGTPEPGPGQVRIDVAAAGVNFLDCYQRSGKYAMDTPFIAGSEGSGTVSAVAPDVTDLSIGDRVAWAMETGGGYAEQVLVAADRTVLVPESVELEEAAAVMLQGMTAHYLCESTFVAHSGHVALVHAAAGGLGLLLTQMLAHKGVRVIGTTSSEEKARLARAAGADEVLLYDGEDIAVGVRALTAERGVDVVFDGVGKTTFEAGLDSLARRGLMVLIGAASGSPPPVDPQTLNKKGSLFLTRPTLAHHISDRAELLERGTAVLAQVASGILQVRVGGRYALADAHRAHEDLEGRRTTGKLLVVPSMGI
ncbi:alcohol dehydrogenase [Nocardioides sp. CF8]|uniref:quinone oxidoreductase family protein n=1 Tax=Nocardioides sp. CF8 TaxID=110319 RepID=UPI000330FB78|nr:quinone oxidoreductase [Nocardioides sp. CF8]EON25708.1 alcohol dehydrogenase [Nocardioides sp. CF8]